ncbi:hypothetical protein [Streptomyces mirabilis]|uniref:hypothetical protein n=1 Tax=Streptomyces mirabilis TaxID=68239 RepID=UPI00331C729B
MDDVEVPSRPFELLLTGFVCHEGLCLANNVAKGHSAHHGDPFGEVFAWLWGQRRGTAVSAFADLLAEARAQAPEGQEVRMDDLLKGLRFALHRTPLSEAREFEVVEATLRAKVPEYFGGRTDL